MTTQAMVPLERVLPAEPIEKIALLRTKFTELQPLCNLVSPITQIDSILPMHKVSFRSVLIDPTVNAKGVGPEVYKGDFCEVNERALGKVAIEKILAAAGVQVLGKVRLDDRSQPYYCEIESTIALRDLDGQWRQVTKTKAVDLRDGAPDAVKLSKYPAVVAHQRANIVSLCETKAMLRAARTLLTIKSKYTVDELAKPFVVPKLVAALDPNDPDQKAALIGIAVQGDRVLYGAPPADPMRALKDVTPTATRELPPPPAPASVASAEPEPADDFQLLDGPDDETEPAIIVCLCPCGDQTEVTKETAETTKTALGTVRCRPCFPGKSFDVARHRDLRDLAIPAKPNLTVEQIEKAQKAAAK